MGKIIGIDLGTTNSCVAVVEGGSAIIIPNDKGERTTPSVVAFTDSGERLIGSAAKRQAAVNADRTIASVKRHMGTDWRKTIAGKSYTPQEISAMILRKLKQDAESYLGEPVTDAVITVPAYFGDIQRQATKDAGRIAGLNVRRIINEPTSAALAYGLNNGAPQKIMVYDLGGGTFDVSIIEIGEGVIEVLATCGNNHLGGDDFDERIVNFVCDAFQREHHADLHRDLAAMVRVKEAAEQAEKSKATLEFVKTTLGDDVKEVRLSENLGTHPVCMVPEEGMTFEMEKYFTAVQPDLGLKAKRILEVNTNHPAFAALESARETDPEKAKKYAEILYQQACLIAGLPIENPSDYTDLLCSLW